MSNSPISKTKVLIYVVQGLVATGALVWIALRIRTVLGPAVTDATPLTFEAHVPETVPRAMERVIPNDHLYWIELNAHNATDSRRGGWVSFTASQSNFSSGERVVTSLEPDSFYLRFPSGDTTATLTPLRSPDPGLLTLTWHVDVDGVRIPGGSHEIEVLDDGVIDWGLKSPKGESLSKLYLMSSLLDWKVRPTDPRPVVSRVERLRPAALARAASAPSYNHAWFGTLYDSLFNDLAFPVGESVEGLSLESDEQQTIRRGEALLSREEAQGRTGVRPIEAAMLVATLSHNMDGDGGPLEMRVWVMPSETRPNLTVLLSWLDTGSVWQAVDLTATDQPFDENVTASTSLVDAWASANRDAYEEFESSGVFLDLGLKMAALDFNQGKEFFRTGLTPDQRQAFGELAEQVLALASLPSDGS